MLGLFSASPGTSNSRNYPFYFIYMLDRLKL